MKAFTKSALIKINNIIFTDREIDIIACITNVRGVKKIANILSISPRTVEGHIQNILLKISASSQEGIKDFVEGSEELLIVREHYCNILIQHVFTQQLLKIAIKFKNAGVVCNVAHTKNDTLDYIISCLELAGIKVIHSTEHKGYSESNTLLILSDEHLLQFQKGSVENNSIFLCLDPRLKSKFLTDLKGICIIDAYNAESLYAGVFKILSILSPSCDLSESISNFNKLKDNVASLRSDVDLLKKSNLSLSQPQTIIKKSRKFLLLILTVLFSTGVLIIGSYITFYQASKPRLVGTNFLIPGDHAFLERKNILDAIKHKFATKNDIEIIVLLGEGGAGKTTLARQYALQQPHSIVWEVNAENNSSLVLSLEKLIFDLGTKEEREELQQILAMLDVQKKEKKLLSLVQSKLCRANDWLIIFDNVEQLNNIYDYLPSNSKLWGRGRVLITTRNANIMHNDYISSEQIIEVGEITADEKLELFKRILGQGQLKQPIKEYTAFLQDIPSFPLDVSVAAYYIKNTGLNLDEYVNGLLLVDRQFAKLQEDIVKESTAYSKTRYNIVSLSVRNILNADPSYQQLLFLISILDSQNIPEGLLKYYGNPHIVDAFIRELKKNSFVTNLTYADGDIVNDSVASFSIHRSMQYNVFAYLSSTLSVDKRQEILQDLLEPLREYILYLVEREDLLGLKNLIIHCQTLLYNNSNLLTFKQVNTLEASLGIIYYYLGEDEKAKQILEANLDKQDTVDRALILTYLGAIYRKIGQDYDQAIRVLKEALGIYVKFPEHSVDMAVTLTHLGNTYRTLGLFPEAASALERSVDIYVQDAADSAGKARAQAYLGVLYREQGKLEEAKGLLESSLKLYEDGDYPYFSAVYAATLSHLGITYRMLGEYDKALLLLEKSMDIYAEIRPKDHPDTGKSVLNLGIVYCELGDYHNAQEYLLKSAADYTKNYGAEHIETGKVLNHLGRFYILIGNIKEAQHALETAYNILFSQNHPESYRSLELKGDLYMQLADEGDIQASTQAIDYYRQALGLANKYFSKDSQKLSKLTQKLDVCGLKP